ncbi:hypothetical protein OMP43_22810 [Sphingomonas sp. CBMAI 2297]|uniref:hypothetical protein n=1 Tax=Sphingomonas sp. CBMAI 2297 TaxID=2991720 RepID=UPI002457F31E|nr:hypothetical protein [Sphingomonas sp. CBMAI 2297]MDH4746859.1 hypothetical protein [Sphingomonas sp. CBMAI 2297]
MITVNFKADLKPLHRALIDLQANQIPFALALGATRLAQGVVVEEADEIDKTFDNPTPFTKKSFAIVPATKKSPVAIVFPKDVQEAYLEPYIVGGNRSLGSKKAMLVPITARTNAYGNLSRNQLAALKGKPNVFVGTVHSRRTGKPISGVWQRTPAKRAPARKGAVSNAAPGKLKLLIAFEDTTPAPKRLDFYGRARRYISRNAAAVFSDALSQAIASARR